MKMQSAESESQCRRAVELICATAVKGLVDCYCPEGVLDLGRILQGGNVRLNMASNLRYIIISQIGIKRWLCSCDCDVQLPDFWEHIQSRRHELNNAGDLGLAIWAGVESSADDSPILAERLAQEWAQMRKACNAVELAWVVQGMTCLSQCHSLTDGMRSVLMDAYSRLTALYCQDTKLFARHERGGVRESLLRRIACFADQVYPMLALANYGHAFDDGKSVEMAAAVADTICLLQGNEGQWWWHYDVRTGTVAEEYPVFSVHQDAMAPMALMAVDRVACTDHSAYIEKGIKWLNEGNELNVMMVLRDRGIIWRDIHRREIGKTYRLARGLLLTAGLEKAHRLFGKNVFGYTVNRECRPYHLGWILYAWAHLAAGFERGSA